MLRRVFHALRRELAPKLYQQFLRCDFAEIKRDLGRFTLFYAVPFGIVYYFQPGERYYLRQYRPEVEEYHESIGKLRPLKYKNRSTPEEVLERMRQAGVENMFEKLPQAKQNSTTKTSK